MRLESCSVNAIPSDRFGPGRSAGRWFLCLAAAVLWALPVSGYGQFFRVYEYKTADAGAVEFSYWTTLVTDSDEDLSYFGDTLSREDLWAYSLEVEYGLSHKLTVGYYADFLNPDAGDCEHIQSKFHVRPGLKFYGDTGELSDPKGSSDQKHYIFPVIDLYCPRYAGMKFHWNFGAGFGLGGRADDVVVKSIATFEFLF